MNKFKTKKIFLIVLSLVLLFTLISCDNSGKYYSINIKEVTGIQNIEVEHGTPVGDVIAKLASKVDVVFTDDSKEEDINVTWDAPSNYDPDVLGDYIFTGTFRVKKTFETVTREAVVSIGKKLISVEEIDDIIVPYGTLFDDIDMPSEVYVTLDNSDSLNLPVTWTCSAYDATKKGTYIAIGTIDISSFPGIENPDDIEAEINITVDDEILKGFFKGELLKIYDDGKKIKINAEDYTQSPTTINNKEVTPLFNIPSDVIFNVAGTSGLREYLDQMSAVNHAILGSTIEVEVIDDEVVQLLSVLLESKEYTHTEMNDILQFRGDYYGLLIKGSAPSATAEILANGYPKVTGDTIEITMPQLILENIYFNNYNTYVFGDDVVFTGVLVNGDRLGIGGYGFYGEFTSITVDEGLYIGDLFSEFGGYITSLDILPDNPGRDSTIIVDGDITGNVKVNASGCSITADSITGDLEVTENGTNAEINVNTIGGSITLGSETLLNITEVNGDLTIDYDGTVIENIEFNTNSDSINIYVKNNTELDGLIVKGANDFKIIVDEDKEVTFNGEIDFTELTGNFIIDVSATGANYVNDATWNPVFSQVDI